MKTYKVLEKHIGENPHDPYEPGDTREMSAVDAKTLLDLKLIEEMPAVDDKPKPVVKKAAN